MIELIKQFGIWALIDVLFIAFIIYYLFMVLRGTRSMQIITGIVIIIGAVFLFSQVYPLNTLKWLMNKFYSSFIIILVILFQDDIRKVLSRMGRRGFLKMLEQNLSSQHMLDEIVRATSMLVTKKLGALIVIERKIILDKYIDIGILLDSKVSMEILVSIFNKESPIHDGAVVIQQGRIAAAGCFLPLTRDENVNPNLGTRHRAAIGISQETDAVVVIVSEERQAVSVVVEGKVSRGLDSKELRKVLRSLIHNTDMNANENHSENHHFTTVISKITSFNKLKLFNTTDNKDE